MNMLTDIVAPGLALGALAALTGLIFHSLRTRRGWLGERGAAQVLTRLVVVLVLAAAFGASAEGLPVVSRSFEAAGATPPEGGVRARTTTTSWRVPFYTRTTARDHTIEGIELGRRITRTLTLPWPFLLVAVLYLLSVQALNPHRGPDRLPRL